MRKRNPLGWLVPAVAVLSAAGSGGGRAAESYPHTVLANGQVRMLVYLPDGRNGYYRGPRFDWSGQVGRIDYRGHTWFSDWRTPHDPTNYEHGIGTAEEFGTPTALGFDEAKPGESFIKIGVGVLEKPDAQPYRFSGRYRFLKPGTWQVKTEGRSIEFTQELAGDRGLAYRYVKRLTLEQDRPEFTIARTLRNTGSRAWETSHYGHNFIQIDGAPVGPAYRVRLPWEPRSAGAPNLREIARLRDREIAFETELGKNQTVYTRLEGFSGNAADHAVTVENVRTGAALSLRSDRPLSRFDFWAIDTAACPEPFVQLRLEPGQETSWSTTYTLSVR